MIVASLQWDPLQRIRVLPKHGLTGCFKKQRLPRLVVVCITPNPSSLEWERMGSLGHYRPFWNYLVYCEVLLLFVFLISARALLVIRLHAMMLRVNSSCENTLDC